MLAVARQSYALTLYTLWHLQQWQRYELFERQSLQHNAAALTAHAIHEPKKLDGLRERFLVESTDRGPSSPLVIADRWTRLRALLDAHARMTPIEPS